MANPPSWPNVQLLLPLDGTDGATSTLDESSNGLSISFHGNAKISTAQSKYGGASLLLDGTGDYLRAALTGSLAKFGTGDFSVEAWIRTSTNQRFIFDTGIYTGNPGAWGLYVNSLNRLEWWYTEETGDYIYETASSTSITTGAWVHVAACRTGSTLRLFVNGAVVRTINSHTINYNYAGSYLYVGDTTATGAAFNGHIDDIRIAAESVYPGAFTPPAEAHPTGAVEAISAYASAATMLGGAELLASSPFGLVAASSPLGAILARGYSLAGLIEAPSPLGSLSATVREDFDPFLESQQQHLYGMDLETPGGLQRVPISSWQATLQVGQDSYLQAVVPACEQWVDALTEATAFTIMRRARLRDGAGWLEAAIASSPISNVQLAQGSLNYTATVSGYSPGAEYTAAPDPALDRTLTGLQTVFTDPSGLRVRCSIDWLLQPGQRAYLGETPIIVGYMNLYATGTQAYVDIGERRE